MNAKETEMMGCFSRSLDAAYKGSTKLLEEQPKEERGAIILLHSIENVENVVGQCYGSPEQWAEMLMGIAQHSYEFRLALEAAYHNLD